MDSVIDARALSKLHWRCRRGLLENDLFVERFFARQQGGVTQRQAQGMGTLMELSDNDLLDLLLRRTEPEGALARDDVIEVLNLMRTPGVANLEDGPRRARMVETAPANAPTRHARNDHDTD